jgi:hypothetical protein
MDLPWLRSSDTQLHYEEAGADVNGCSSFAQRQNRTISSYFAGFFSNVNPVSLTSTHAVSPLP